MATQTGVAQRRLLANVSPNDGLAGSVIASPSRHDPDYYYHWVRDAALVMDTILTMYERSTDVAEKRHLIQHVLDFANFTRVNQTTQTIAGIGEVKFYVSGDGFLGPWGRPQNDGPALRASTLIRLGKILRAAGYETYFLNSIWPAIRTDLEYVSHEWKNPSFDLWEEIKGDHFYTRLVQRRALLDGAEIALAVGDSGFSVWLKTQAVLIEATLPAHISEPAHTIFENLHRVDGVWYKNSGLDAATVLGLLHTKSQPYLGWADKVVVNSVSALERRFAALYQINLNSPQLGTAIGRYPEDRYYGGNPWFLTTLAYAEYHYELAHEYAELGKLAEAKAELALGDRYVERVRRHVDQNGSMAEQMWRDNGYMMSAADLTWSYASWLTAAWARENAAQIIP